MGVELAKAMIQRECAHPEVRDRFIEEVRAAEAKNRNCTLGVDGQLTKSGRPLLACIHSGELFIFELHPKQARCLGIEKGMLRCTRGIRARTLCASPLASLTRFELDPLPSCLEPVGGVCGFEVAAHSQERWCLSLEYEISDRGNTTVFVYPPAPGFLRSQARYRFRFPPICKPEQPPWQGTVVAFLRLMRFPEAGAVPDIPLSGVLAVLLDVP